MTARTPFSQVFRQRLVVVGRELGVAVDDSRRTWLVLVDVAAAARAAADSRSAWLLFAAAGGCLPTEDEVLDLRRRLQLASSDEDAAVETLAATRQAASSRGTWDLPLRIIRNGVVVDVDFCAKYEHNTGVQRVVRESVSRWVAAGLGVDLVAWDHQVFMRSLYVEELARASRWASTERDHNENNRTGPSELVLPLDSTVLVMEVPHEAALPALAALAEFSGNRVCIVGHDAIPLISADLVPAEESERFAHFLSFVKFVDEVFGVSGSAAGEFAGFAAAVRAQGIPGPRVRSISLPVDLPDVWQAVRERAGVPLVISVGSHEPRKNQEAVLQAAQLAWRDGVSFRLVFVGRGYPSRTGPFDRRLAELRRRGHDVEARRSTSDQELSALMHEARVSVFPSIHEGFGLPLAESLAAGTPVITSAYGSMNEIASAGGALVVDPRDDRALATALATVLTDAEVHESLQAGLAARPPRTWDDYASELWAAVVGQGAST